MGCIEEVVGCNGGCGGYEVLCMFVQCRCVVCMTHDV